MAARHGYGQALLVSYEGVTAGASERVVMEEALLAGWAGLATIVADDDRPVEVVTRTVLGRFWPRH